MMPLELFKYAVNLSFKIKALLLSPAVSTSKPDKSTLEVIISKLLKFVFLITEAISVSPLSTP